MNGDLVAFLRARLDEDEAYGPRPVQPGEYYNEFKPGEPGAPERVLREIAAKRAILADRPEWGDRVADKAMYAMRQQMIRILAAVYRDHPDYRQEWAP